LPPDRRNTLFVWQVAVSGKARGEGLGKTMVFKLLKRASDHNVNYLETTITPDNKASWALFTSIADAMGAELNTTTLFDKKQHFNGDHESEVLLRIGPFAANKVLPHASSAPNASKVTPISKHKAG
jgi:L-2,4-diaminobutyric acid acetyltransferase